MNKKWLLLICCLLGMLFWAIAQVPGKDRKLWLSYLDKIARPVLTNLAANTLKEKSFLCFKSLL